MMRTLALVLLSITTGCGAELGTYDPNANGKADHPGSDQNPAPSPRPSPQPGPSTDGGAGSDASCGGMQFELARVPPNVMLVLDRSGSMGDSIGGGSATSKWTDLKNAISGLVQSYDSQVRLGVSLFSSDGNCAPGQITPYAANNGSTVMSKINGDSPGGNTPTAATLQAVLTSGLLNDPTRENVVVLATDGLPNCNDVDVTSRITALYNATPSVKTYVIGVGDDTASNPGLLNQWADAGHTAQTGATHYFQTGSPAALKNAFDTIVNGVVSCTFKMGMKAPDPSLLYVWSNGVQVPADPNNGYTYDDNGPTVTLHGASCDQLKNNPSTKVQVVYGCPSPPIN